MIQYFLEIKMIKYGATVKNEIYDATVKILPPQIQGQHLLVQHELVLEADHQCGHELKVYIKILYDFVVIPKSKYF